MKQYARLTHKKRCLIELGIRVRKSMRAIGLLVDRPAKTVSEEIKRNGGLFRYYAEKAHYHRTMSNRKNHSKIDGNDALRSYIDEKLSIGWSPEVIAGSWNLEEKSRMKSLPAVEANIMYITHGSIYAWVINKIMIYT